MDYSVLQKSFLDEQGRLTAFPAKRRVKMIALSYIAERIEAGRTYTEKEFGELLEQWHTFGDPATLRRELYNNMFIDRDNNGSNYRRREQLPDVDELMQRYG